MFNSILLAISSEYIDQPTVTDFSQPTEASSVTASTTAAKTERINSFTQPEVVSPEFSSNNSLTLPEVAESSDASIPATNQSLQPQVSEELTRLATDSSTAAKTEHFAQPEVISPEFSSTNSLTLPEVAESSDASIPATNPSSNPQVLEELTTFLVGIKLNGRNVITSVLVRGQEDGTQAVNFEKWLIPYDTLVQTLKLTTEVLPDNQIELSSPLTTIRLDLSSQLQTDPELGLVFSVEQLRNLFGVEVEFDILDYAITLEAPWLNRQRRNAPREIIVETEGLPKIAPSGFALGALEQRLDTTSREGSSANYRGDLSAVGSIFGGSWFIRADQPELFSGETWTIAEAQFQRQTDPRDYIIGSQSPFWRSESGENYWGFTAIRRSGFVPQIQLSGAADPKLRLQAAQMSRTISGRAEPGTLVQLVQSLSNYVIAEVLVDSTGIYRFEDIEFDNRGLGNYRVLLYPQGQLTEQPEIRTATFSNLPGQIPAGSSAIVVSGGWRREFSGVDNQGLLGNFSDFQGGVLGRYGLSDSLTVGVGAIHDQSLRGLGEIFFQPENFPLTVALSALTGTEDEDLDINADVIFEPSSNFSARLTSDRFSTRFNTTWQLFPGFSLIGSTSTKDATAAGIQLAFSGRNSLTLARATFDTKSRFRWNLLQRLNQFELKSNGNEISTRSELAYHFPPGNFSNGNSLVLGYDTRSGNGDDNLLSLSWRYRSRERSSNGYPLWDAQLGYGTGSQGSGIIASVGTNVIPGLRLQARYQGVSVTSDESSFSLSLVSSLNLQRRVTPSNIQANYLRTQGGISVEPFLDANQNGKKDQGEQSYTDADLLFINQGKLGSMRAEIKEDQIALRLPPGTYRLDLDPAGFPPDWQAAVKAYAVEVVAGGYTSLSVPLIRSYTRSGVVTDKQGNPISGARVEAVETTNGERVFSVTNDAGVYYLEGLQQGNYTLQVNGQQASPNFLELKDYSEPFAELNLEPIESKANCTQDCDEREEPNSDVSTASPAL
ncbi:MAG: carboxypeptidase-like regulatory domain-containing protein [Coleofasciculaceae cyanobacterium]